MVICTERIRSNVAGPVDEAKSLPKGLQSCIGIRAFHSLSNLEGGRDLVVEPLRVKAG
jgi:hypothetical protein